MTALTTTTSRLVWRWCLAYTFLAGKEIRERRREEISAHLWECERARLSATYVLRTGLRGAGHDIAWVASLRARQVSAALATPTPYFVVAAVSVITGAFSSAVLPHHGVLTGRLEGGGLLCAVAALAVGLVCAWRSRRRG